jgi:putative ABC transport system permease protein
MLKTFQLAFMNLFRYSRRTLLTAILISFGVVLVVVTAGFTAGFKHSVTSILTDAMLSHMQFHKSGYMENVSTNPADIYLDRKEMEVLESKLTENPNVLGYSPRIIFMSMISTYIETTNIRLMAVLPEKENAVCPAVVERIEGHNSPSAFVKPGEIIIPDTIARGMELETGDEIVLVATNRHGSVNGMTLTVAGFFETFGGNMSKYGYIHLDDALFLLRMDEPEISEVAVRLKELDNLAGTMKQIRTALSGFLMPDSAGAENPVYEIHPWNKLTPFTTILVLIDLVNYIINFILIAIVLISIMNIMMMSVYERTKEIGTIAAIGTTPGKILKLFLAEGFSLGLISTIAGLLSGFLGLFIINSLNLTIKAGPLSITLITKIHFLDIFITSLIVLGVSVFASFQPAFKASRLEPVDALGHV